MQRQTSPLILLYGFGLALVVSLAFNGFLLFRQTHRVSLYEYEASTSVNSADSGVWQQQLSDCRQASQVKDSVIHRLELVSNTPSTKGTIVQQTASK